MRILLLGPERPALEGILLATGDAVRRTEQALAEVPELLEETDFIVSFGYRHIVRKHVLERFPGRVVNLHASYLPWNRGADPNLWSILEDTPKGVTIHMMDEGIDTGLLLAQREVGLQPGDTLRSSYDRLTEAIITLFEEIWSDVRSGRMKGQQQAAGGSLHRLKDRAAVEHLLTCGWDTPVADLIGKVAREI